MNDILFEDLPLNKELVQQINIKLVELGFLDPLFECSLVGKPGPLLHYKASNGIVSPLDANHNFYSEWSLDSAQALKQWMALNQLLSIDTKILSGSVLNTLFAAETYELAFNKFDADTRLAFKVAKKMQYEGFYINRGLGINTVYLEGVDINGVENKDQANYWNDLCVWFTVSPGGIVNLVGKAICTTEPGKYYTDNPTNKKGAARIAFGQYKAWIYGFHKGKQPALIQAKKLKVHRDTDHSTTRSKKDTIQIVTGVGINLHSTGPGLKPKTVGKFSAGCLVIYDYDLHMEWLTRVTQSDYRAKVANYVHIAAVMAGPIN